MAPNPDVFDTFLSAPRGKFIVGAVSVVIALVSLLTRYLGTYDDDDRFLRGNAIRKREIVAHRDALFLAGFVALMLRVLYLVWSVFTVQ